MSDDRRRTARTDARVWTPEERDAYRERLAQPGPVMGGLQISAADYADPWGRGR